MLDLGIWYKAMVIAGVKGYHINSINLIWNHRISPYNQICPPKYQLRRSPLWLRTLKTLRSPSRLRAPTLAIIRGLWQRPTRLKLLLSGNLILESCQRYGPWLVAIFFSSFFGELFQMISTWETSPETSSLRFLLSLGNADSLWCSTSWTTLIAMQLPMPDSIISRRISALWEHSKAFPHKYNNRDWFSNRYNTCISILFVGYLLMQIPSNMLMSSNKIRPSLYMGICMAAWSIVSALTALVKDYKGLVMVRFFLGVAEAPYCKCLLLL